MENGRSAPRCLFASVLSSKIARATRRHPGASDGRRDLPHHAVHGESTASDATAAHCDSGGKTVVRGDRRRGRAQPRTPHPILHTRIHRVAGSQGCNLSLRLRRSRRPHRRPAAPEPLRRTAAVNDGLRRSLGHLFTVAVAPFHDAERRAGGVGDHRKLAAMAIHSGRHQEPAP
jgi:hypothetical protein